MAKVGFGIIGCGTIGPIHAEGIAKVRDARLVAVADVVRQSAEALADRYGAAAYTDLDEMLERDDLHAVCICVPSGMRAEMAEKCAKAGKHILAEKPIEVNVKRANRMLAAADKANVKLGCVFQSRFGDGPAKVRKAIEKGRFGKLVLGDAYVKWYRSTEYYDSGSWRGTRKLDGGGCLMNQGVHQIDLLLWFMGEPESVQARTALVGHKGLEIEDLACAMIQFKNGAMGVIEGSTAIWPGHSARVEVHGTEGSAIIEDSQLTFWQFKKETKADAKLRETFGGESALGSGASDPMSHLTSEGHRRQIHDFVRAIQQDRPPLVDGREAVRSIALLEAIYKSAAAGGKAVRL